VADGARIEGLAEMRSGLASATARMPQAIRTAGEQAAALIGGEARSVGAALGSVAAKAAGSISVMRNEVVLDEPFGWGAEKGSVRFHQFKPYLAGDEAGYFVGPAVTQSEASVEALYERAIDDAVRPAFPN
jgi:hypothetical protein